MITLHMGKFWQFDTDKINAVTNITIFKCVDKMSGQLIKWSDIVCYMFMPSGLCLCMHNIVLLLSNKGYQAV